MEQAATGVEPSTPYLIVMGDDGRDLAASEHHVLPWELVDHPGTGVQGMVEGIVTTVSPVPALQSAGSLHRQDLLVNRLPLATQAHRELGMRGVCGGDEMSPRADASTSPGQCSAAHTPRTPCHTYLVGDDCFVVINARVQLPAAELTPPATGDGASSDPTQRAAWQRHQKLAS